MIVKGTVTKITNFGVFVELEAGPRRPAAHLRTLRSEDREPEEIVKVGEELEVKILRVDIDERKIGLSLKRAQWTADQEQAAQRTEQRQQPAGGGLGGLGTDSGALGTDKITFGQGGAKPEE